MNYRRNDWKYFSCVLRNHRSLKKRHIGQNLQYQLANEDDLQSKSVIKEFLRNKTILTSVSFFEICDFAIHKENASNYYGDSPFLCKKQF